MIVPVCSVPLLATTMMDVIQVAVPLKIDWVAVELVEGPQQC